MQKREERRIVTLWKECDWDGGTNFPADGPLAIYDSLNQAVGEIAQYGTIHSVSYSQLVISSRHTLRLFATVVYSGPVPIEMFEPNTIYKTVREMTFVWPVEDD